MEENKVLIEKEELARLYRMDGEINATVRYIEAVEKESGFVDIRIIRAILGI